jgi:hypothetical protein
MYQPILPLGGLGGWLLLNRTLPAQTEAFNATPTIKRDTDYFEAMIAKVSSAEELVADRRLLTVALGAFGLEDDINSQFLVRKVLDSDLGDPRSLANSMADARYKQLSEAFRFGDSVFGPRVTEEGFGAEITAKFRARAFEAAVGEQDQSFRLAMNATRELAAMGNASQTDDTRWFRVLGTPPLRAVFETAFGLPQGFGQLDIERQLEVFKDEAAKRLDVQSFDEFADDAVRDRLVQSYLVREQINGFNALSPQSVALSLLQA